MDLQTFEIGVGIMFAVVIGLGMGMFAVFNYAVQDEIEKTRRGFSSLARVVGYEQFQNSISGEISFWITDLGKLPATRGDVEEFFKDHNEHLAAVYQHLGIKVKPKVTPAVPEKHEIVVEKVVKK